MTQTTKRSGTKSVTLRDIAREARVSVAAVSLALRDHPSVSHDTRRRIKRISERMCYEPIRRRRKPSTTEDGTGRIGLAFNGMERPDAVAELLNVLSVVGDQRDVSVEVLRSSGQVGDGVVEAIHAQADRYDGLLIAGHLEAHELQSLTSITTPWVVMGLVGGVDMPPCRSVMADIVEASRSLTSRLLDAGHESIGFFCGPTSPGLWNDRWRLGYLQAHHMARRTVEPDHILTDLPVRIDDVGLKAAELYADMPSRPTAYITPTVYAATRFLARSRSLGYDVESNAIMSGGTSEQARDCHGESLPLARLDHRRLAQVAVAALVEAIDQPDLPPVTRLLPVEFIPGVSPQSGTTDLIPKSNAHR